MTTDIRAALDAAELALSQGDSHAARQRIAAARAVLAAEPAGEGPSDEEITLQAGKFLAYSDAHMGDPARWEGSDADLLAFARAVLPQPARPAAPPTPEPPAEALAARPLLEQVARLGDCIGANTVGQIMAISSRAAAWLEENPSGQPVAIEPRGCPTPGACSCVEPAPAAPKPGEVGELVEWLWSMRELAGEHNPEEQRRYDRAAALLQSLSAPAPAVVPVAVGEVLPSGTWWVFSPGNETYCPAWVALELEHARALRATPFPITHLLPAHAIPLPQGGEGEA